MGHRSYLYLNKKEENFYAFEANNSVPFFWLTLIDTETLNNKTREWKIFEEYSKNHTEIEFENYILNKSLGFKINFNQFKKNYSKGERFIINHFPEVITLYNDFIKTLKLHFEKSDTLKIEIDEISAFYNSLDEYIIELSNEINAIETGKPENIRFLNMYDLIASGTGFESINLKSFSKLPSYIEAYKNRRAVPIKNQKNNPQPRKQSFIIGIVILLISPIFTYITYRGYIADGPSFTVCLIGLFNLLFYLYSFGEVTSNFKAYTKPTGNKSYN
jgi:hypothetical protein